ncbi:unnamed protein product, partial [marine sediment metagenome]
TISKFSKFIMKAYSNMRLYTLSGRYEFIVKEII